VARPVRRNIPAPPNRGLSGADATHLRSNTTQTAGSTGVKGIHPTPAIRVRWVSDPYAQGSLYGDRGAMSVERRALPSVARCGGGLAGRRIGAVPAHFEPGHGCVTEVVSCFAVATGAAKRPSSREGAIVRVLAGGAIGPKRLDRLQESAG
jgi:hypothetical protein